MKITMTGKRALPLQQSNIADTLHRAPSNLLLEMNLEAASQAIGCAQKKEERHRREEFEERIKAWILRPRKMIVGPYPMDKDGNPTVNGTIFSTPVMLSRYFDTQDSKKKVNGPKPKTSRCISAMFE
ncbi:MAG: hypothetical protein M1812_006789 [Candelaria pacifica]|nr:MAG: hypothetical protein M1812_006789 [Candelaria pacifica]